MEKPQFTRYTIEEKGKSLLYTLYLETQGDEWEPKSVEDVYTAAGFGTELHDNKPFRNNILQYLIHADWITINEHHDKIKITPIGKLHLYNSRPELNAKRK